MGAGESAMSSVENLEQNFANYNNVDSLQFVQQANNIRYGEVKVVQNMETNKRYAIKSLIFSNKNEFKEVFQEVSNKKQNIQIPSMVNIVDVKTEVNEHFCSNFYKIIIIYEFIDSTLEKLIEMNRSQNTPFNEQDIYYLIDCLLSALMCMHYNQINHCDIRPKTVVVSSDGAYKITDINFLNSPQPTPYKQTILGAASYHQMYLSPEKLSAIKSRELTKLQEYAEDWQKGDVFSLGLIALEMATLRSVTQEIIDYETLEIQKSVISELLEIVKSRYSFNLYSLISQMLEFQYSQRYDFYKLAEILTPSSQQDSILSLQSNHLQQNQVKEFMLSDSHKKGQQQQYQQSPQQKLRFVKKGAANKQVSNFDDVGSSIRQSTIAVETNDVTREDINKMMKNNENSEIFNRYKLRRPSVNKKQANEDTESAQARFKDHCNLNINMHSKSPRYVQQENKNLNTISYVPSLQNTQSTTPRAKNSTKNTDDKENFISYKIERQTNLLSQLEKLDLKVHDILEQSQTIKNQFQSKKIEEAVKQPERDDQELYDVIEKKKQSIRNLKMEKDMILSHQNSQKSLYQFQEQPSYISLNNYATTSQSNKGVQSPSSQNSKSCLNIPNITDSNRNRKEESSPYSSKYLNYRTKSPISSKASENGQNQYFESVNSIGRKPTYKNYQDYCSKNSQNPYTRNYYKIDSKQASVRSVSRKPYEEEQEMTSKRNQDRIAERILQNTNNISHQQQDYHKSRNQSPILYQPAIKSSNFISHNNSFISKQNNPNSSTISNQQNNKSNITLYELYLKDYENMIKKSQDQLNLEQY